MTEAQAVLGPEAVVQAGRVEGGTTAAVGAWTS
jgi:hypothetical protein